MYNNNEKVKNIQLRKEEWQTFIEPDYAVSKQGESFPEILSRYIDNSKRFHIIFTKPPPFFFFFDIKLSCNYDKII